MAGLTAYAKNKILDHSTGTASWTAPSALYLAHFSTDPTEDVSGTELSGNGYARVELAFDSASSGSTSNSTQTDFAAATGSDWDEAGWWVLFDAGTGGNGIWYGAWDTPPTVVVGQQFRVRDGDVDLSIT